MENSRLRPATIDSFLGQDKVKRILKIAIESAKKRKTPLDHILLYGPPGVGKTTLSMIIASEMGRSIKLVSAPMIERRGDLVALINSLDDGDVLLIDEIHRLNRSIEESMYSAMEDFRIDIVTGIGMKARSVSISLPKFTLIGATTRLSLVSSPLRSRFGIVCRLGFYTEEELVEIARRTAELLELNIADSALKKLAVSSRGIPRILNQIIKRIRDYATVNSWKLIDADKAEKVLRELGIDEFGLDSMDRKIIKTIAATFNGGPVGINALSLALNEDIETIESIHEPYLIKLGMIERTPRGRKITKLAYKYILRSTC